jgi:UDP-N-acetylmuramate--alanine ligase
LTLDLAQLSLPCAREAVERCRRFHFIGVGGVGMSALARWLARHGKAVTGSDRSDGERLAALRREGVEAWQGHDAAHVAGADCVVYTTAIPHDNPELRAARAAGLPILHRAEVLAAIVTARSAIAITGTHGKSTTTALLGSVLERAGLDPLVIVGGDAPLWDGNIRFGEGAWAVFEACESDGTIALYQGCSQVITSLEPDHLDQYGSFAALAATLSRFAASADPEGFVVYGADAETVADVAASAPVTARRVGYGVSAGDYRVADWQPLGEGGSRFTLHGPAGATEVRLRLWGRHNALNAAAAIAAAAQAGVDEADSARALADLRGVGRRMERLGSLGTSAVFDDYAHHPTEVRATLEAARLHLGLPILAIFQPHLYSRTRDLLDGFAAAFGDADDVIITDIYAAREEPIAGVSAEDLAARAAANRPGRSTRFIAGFDDIEAAVRGAYRDGWAILVLGAGDVRKLGERLAREPAHA